MAKSKKGWFQSSDFNPKNVMLLVGVGVFAGIGVSQVLLSDAAPSVKNSKNLTACVVTPASGSVGQDVVATAGGLDTSKLYSWGTRTSTAAGAFGSSRPSADGTMTLRFTQWTPDTVTFSLRDMSGKSPLIVSQCSYQAM